MSQQFSIFIDAEGGHGCERRARPGEKLYGRCQKLTCSDCLTYDFVQQLRQKGYKVKVATFTHDPHDGQPVVDDLLLNQRREGQL